MRSDFATILRRRPAAAPMAPMAAPAAAVPEPPRILRTPEVAARTGLGPSTLVKMRGRGDGPPFVRLGPRCVGYLEADLDHWLRARRTLSTRTTGPAVAEAGG